MILTFHHLNISYTSLTRKHANLPRYLQDNYNANKKGKVAEILTKKYMLISRTMYMFYEIMRYPTDSSVPK